MFCYQINEQQDMCNLLVCSKAAELFSGHQESLNFKVFLSGAPLIDGTHCGPNKVCFQAIRYAHVFQSYSC